MQKTYKALIIGGGASGLISAIELVSGENALDGSEVIILEKCDRVAKKLSVTGNGQGNVTNENVSEEFYHGEKYFIKKFLSHFNSINLKNYLYKMGIPLFSDAKGRCYPLSRQASAISDVLRFKLSKKGVKIELNSPVEKIEYNGEYYTCYANGKTFSSENVIFSVGGKCAKHFGTDGESYSLLNKFGHKTGELYPSLVQLKAEKSCIKGLSGIKETASLTAKDGESILAKSKGDILFTDYGISGNATFEISGHVAKAKNPEVLVEFLPDLDLNSLTKIIDNNIKENGENFAFTAVINKKLGQKILLETKDKSAENLARIVKNYSIKITGTLGFNYAQVTKGGFTLKNVNEDTFESKLSKNLYLVGECLDVDGDCGGYNLTFAFVSGIISARNIKNSYNSIN